METKSDSPNDEKRDNLRARIVTLRDVLRTLRHELKDAGGNAIDRMEMVRAYGICDQIHDNLDAVLGIVAFAEYDEARLNALGAAEDF